MCAQFIPEQFGNLSGNSGIQEVCLKGPLNLSLSSTASSTITGLKWATFTRWSVWCLGSMIHWYSSPSPCSSVSSSRTRWVSVLQDDWENITDTLIIFSLDESESDMIIYVYVMAANFDYFSLVSEESCFSVMLAWQTALNTAVPMSLCCRCHGEEARVSNPSSFSILVFLLSQQFQQSRMSSL